MLEEVSVSESWLASQCDRLCARAAAVPLEQRNRFIDEQIELLPISNVLKIALQNMMWVKEITTRESMGATEKVAGFTFGIAFVVAVLILAIFIPNPTAFQYFVFRVVLSLAAAGVCGILSGFLTVAFGNAKPWLQAGGGLAVFVVVYLVNPAKLAVEIAGH
jgi:VIT1/CCC1 family predicted Fe2+/Mn2+ transporter